MTRKQKSRFKLFLEEASTAPAGFVTYGLIAVIGLCLFGGMPPERVRAAALGDTTATSPGPTKRELFGRVVDWTQGGDGRPLITLETREGNQLMAYVADTAEVGRGLVGHIVKAVGTESPGGLFVVDTSLQKAQELAAASDPTEPTTVQVKDGWARGSSGFQGLALDLPDGNHTGHWLRDGRGRLMFQSE